jgi:hypothetical protein
MMAKSTHVDLMSELAGLVRATDAGRIRVAHSNGTYTLMRHGFDWNVPIYDLTADNVMDFLLKLAGVSPLSEGETLSILPEDFVTVCPSEDGQSPIWAYHRKVGGQYMADWPFKRVQNTWWSVGVPSLGPSIMTKYHETLKRLLRRSHNWSSVELR